MAAHPVTQVIGEQAIVDILDLYKVSPAVLMLMFFIRACDSFYVTKLLMKAGYTRIRK